MIIGIDNLPPDVTAEDIAHLLPHVEIAALELVVAPPRDKSNAWVNVGGKHRAWLHNVARELDGRYYRGRVLAATDMLFFSH